MEEHPVNLIQVSVNVAHIWFVFNPLLFCEVNITVQTGSFLTLGAPGLFLTRLYKCTGRAIALPLASVAAWTKCLSFTLKFFNVMGKALSGELSCMWTGLVNIF